MKKYLLALPFVLCHAQDIPPKIRAAERAVVKIASYRFMGSHYDVFHCSGVFLSYGIVATNYHCVGDGSTVSVVPKVPEGEVSPMLPASVIAFSETFDLALIEVQEDDHPGVPAPLGSFSRGEEALYMMGYPNGVFRTLKGKPSKPWFIIKNWFDVGYWHFFDSDPTSQWQFPMEERAEAPSSTKRAVSSASPGAATYSATSFSFPRHILPFSYQHMASQYPSLTIEESKP